MNKERDSYSGSKEEIRLSKSALKHIRLLKQKRDTKGVLEFREKELERKKAQRRREKELERKKAQRRRELEELERRLKEESDPYKIAEMKFTTPLLKKKLGDITEHERKQDIKNIITGLEQDIFKKFVMEENGNGKTKVREIIDKIFPRDESLNELEELEIKQMGEKYLSPEEALEIKFTHIWLEVKLGKIVKDEERFEKIINVYKGHPDIAEAFKRDKAREIVNSLFPSEERRRAGRGAKSFKAANRKD